MNKRQKTIIKIILIIVFFLMACTPDLPSGSNSQTYTGDNQTNQQNFDSRVVSSTFVNFSSFDFYNILNLSQTSCAGDAKNYYDPTSLANPSDPSSGPRLLPDNPNKQTATVLPSFVKNISVDITDANSPSVSNQTCAFGNIVNGIQNTSVAPPSNCATFDYGTINGLSSTLSGNIFIFGAKPSSCSLSSASTIPPNYCTAWSYALAIDTTQSSGIPAPIWENLNPGTSYTGPPGKQGAAFSYDSEVQKLLIFGGYSLQANTIYSNLPTSENWIFSRSNQNWSQISVYPAVNPNMLRISDYSSSSSTQLSKNSAGRALFGYASVAGMAISQLGTFSQLNSPSAIPNPLLLDTTERIIIQGGLGSACNQFICTDTFRFNPTYGPEYFDIYNAQQPITSGLSSSNPLQWIDSYHTQIISNGDPHSQYYPAFPTPTPSPLPTGAVSGFNSGMIGLNNMNTSTTGLLGAGYILTAGGFSGYSNFSYNKPTGNCSNLYQCGGMQIFLKWFDPNLGWNQSNEQHYPNSISVTNDLIGNRITPGIWQSIRGSGDPTPWFGGASLLKGLNVASMNEAVYFGGSDCKTYLHSNSSFCQNIYPSSSNYTLWPVSATNPGAYWQFGVDPANNLNTGSRYPSSISMVGTPPINAGMAAARGLDPSGNPIILAWGGMSNLGALAPSNIIYYLYKNNNVPTWGNYTFDSNSILQIPRSMANASMVFSHVTRKFYLYGGFLGDQSGTSNATWELAILPGSPYSFQWRQLNTIGQTCYPSCPPASHSHRMAEVNYNVNYSNLSAEPDCSQPSKPCSFGIFMEGGTTNGTTFFSDRWMYDPAANNGLGHWQLMGELPPRTLSAMSSVDYTTITGIPVHRAVLFGGETGLQNPSGVPLSYASQYAQNNYMIPPTLGDTWMYDYDTKNWNRVTLFGKRYNSFQAGSASELEARAASNLTDDTTTLFSPPPLSGAVMVTRTLSNSSHMLGGTSTPLAIPELFLLGGRQKDGGYHPLTQVFKFCAGTTGEKPTVSPNGPGVVIGPPYDTSCDAYDYQTNPQSPSPSSEYVGRWLVKSPLAPSSNAFINGSFLGAGTYDSLHDLIILYGGIKPGSASARITDSTQRISSADIIEYIPPSQASGSTDKVNGKFQLVSACPCINSTCRVPNNRYGHTMSYDSQHQAILVMGGYDISSPGNPLVTANGAPEIWMAYRVDNATPKNLPSQAPVDLSSPAATFPCYYWTQVTPPSSSASSQAQPSNGLGQGVSIFFPPAGYNTGYYTTNDALCDNAGPIINSYSDPRMSRLLAGGAYIDIDRTQLGPSENLILNLTFLPLGTSNLDPTQNPLPLDQTAIFYIHLIKTRQSADAIRQEHQPRYLTYSSTAQFPQIVQKFAILSQPTGQVRQEQFVIPLSMSADIDRIRIERYSGNAILIDAAVYRLGTK